MLRVRGDFTLPTALFLRPCPKSKLVGKAGFLKGLGKALTRVKQLGLTSGGLQQAKHIGVAARPGLGFLPAVLFDSGSCPVIATTTPTLFPGFEIWRRSTGLHDHLVPSVFFLFATRSLRAGPLWTPPSARRHRCVAHNPGMGIPMPRLALRGGCRPLTTHQRRAAAPLPTARALDSKACLVEGLAQTGSWHDRVFEARLHIKCNILARLGVAPYDARRSTRLALLSISKPTPNTGTLSDGLERSLMMMRPWPNQRSRFGRTIKVYGRESLKLSCESQLIVRVVEQSVTTRVCYL